MVFLTYYIEKTPISFGNFSYICSFFFRFQVTGWTKKNRNSYKYDSNFQDISDREN